MKNADKPAYPYPDMAQFDFSLGEMMGLTKREWFAGMAMQGIIIRDKELGAGIIAPRVDLTTTAAYAYADAMLEKP
ncbi:hypothetical protein LCGC14_3104360 [marine sediment metagenome]|uniref:Uncharacterized protein n=1 Tax=marine sediment metagenome TaxID=412755 RepID=A0A0F8W794_9ZZZZ